MRQFLLTSYVRNVANDIYISAQTLVNNTYEGTPTIGRTYGANLHVSY